MYARRPQLLALALLAFLGSGCVEGFGTLTPGRKWVKLTVPGACRGSSGWLGPDVCGAPSGNALLLKIVAGGPWATWRLAAAPALAMAPTNGSLSQYVLERVVGTPDQFYIHVNARGAGCPKRYLGAAITATRRGCSAAQLGLFAKDAAKTVTRWQITDRPALPPCAPPPSPPRPRPPPPRPSPPSPSPPPPSPSPPPPSPSPPPPPSPSPPPPNPSPPPPPPEFVPECFPAHATVSLACGKTVRISELRTGDRMLSVDWRGRLTHAEVFYWSHWEPPLLGVFTTVSVQEAGAAGVARRLQLGRTHYLPASRDATGACAALAAASAAGRNASALEPLVAAWTAASGAVSWEGHTMMLPPQLSPGMVAWVGAAGAGSVAPACILSTEQSVERGAFAPVVRARGIVVDGVVASTQTDWYTLHGRSLLPDSSIPTLAYHALTPLWWAYKLAGPELAWRVNRLPAVANRHLANALVWGPVLLAALALWAAAAWNMVGAHSSSWSSRPALFRAQTRRRSAHCAAAVWAGRR